MSFWNSLGDILWWTLWFFAFFAYLWAVIAIITDLFRDHKLNGWWKAVWIIFLIFVPFLTALVYLIARGSGMAERSMRSAENLKRQQDAYIREVAGQATPADQIAQAKSMLDTGAISQSEYDQLKAKALLV
jgi:phospholipase D-like protein/putative oligomerization/nucleic acid binding protein